MSHWNTRTHLYDLMYQIYDEFEHGECFFDEEMFDGLIESLNDLIKLSTKYFNENMEEDI